MNFFSDTQETASRFGDYIDDLHDVFRCNDVDFGAPEDFFAFARTLKYHSELRGDVLRVVKSVMDGETNVAFRTILTIIAVASGGCDVATSDREISVPVKLVIESLIGVGACSQLNADHPGLYSDLTVTETAETRELDSFSSDRETGRTAEERVPILARDESSSDGTEAAGAADVPGHTGVEETFFETRTSDSSLDQSLLSSQGLPSSQSLPNGYSGPPNGHQGPLNDHGGSNTLAESLTRLELNSLQLKVYLDSIDQRISRMEPRLEKVAPLVPSTSPVHAKEEPEARFSAAVPSEKESQSPGDDAPLSKQQGGATTAVSGATGPLAVPVTSGTDSGQFHSGQYHSVRRQIALPIFVGVAVLLLTALLSWRFGRDTGAAVRLPVNASVEGGLNAGAASVATPAAPAVSRRQAATGLQAATVRGPQVAPAGAPSAPVSGRQGESSATGYTGLEVSRMADKSAASPKKPAQVPLGSSLRSSSSAAPATMAKDAAEVTDDPSDDVEDSSSVPLANRPMDVASGVMAANLLSAPKPSYPTLAILTRMQGNVVMHAVISKEGTVEELHVVKGHRLLRGAAKNAVRKWRYRPYKIDGVPMEVATTVSVEFSLHH
jgi:TonB family protein